MQRGVKRELEGHTLWSTHGLQAIEPASSDASEPPSKRRTGNDRRPITDGNDLKTELDVLLGQGIDMFHQIE